MHQIAGRRDSGACATLRTFPPPSKRVVRDAPIRPLMCFSPIVHFHPILQLLPILIFPLFAAARARGLQDWKARGSFGGKTDGAACSMLPVLIACPRPVCMHGCSCIYSTYVCNHVWMYGCMLLCITPCTIPVFCCACFGPPCGLGGMSRACRTAYGLRGRWPSLPLDFVGKAFQITVVV